MSSQPISFEKNQNAETNLKVSIGGDIESVPKNSQLPVSRR